MIRLRVSGTPQNLDRMVVGPVHRGASTLNHIRIVEVDTPPSELEGKGVLAVLLHDSIGRWAHLAPTVPIVSGLKTVEHLEDGDIVAVHPNGRIDTLFRSSSDHNALFLTDRCNSNCLMCSQPPRDVDDLDHFLGLNMELIRNIPKTTQYLGLTGGEPTLLGWRLLALLKHARSELPDTHLHMLTNGRALAWKHVAAAIASATSSRLTLGIPLYADHSAAHDYIVQADNAFVQTVTGLHNCAVNGIDVEIRIVLHRFTYQRLPALARFIQRNLVFASHVAIMAMEDIGYARYNHELLAIEPKEYLTPLQEAVEYLADLGMNVSLYNFPLCLIPPALWQFARHSISDWKREYLQACNECSVRAECGGVFGTSLRQSAYIAPVTSRPS